MKRTTRLIGSTIVAAVMLGGPVTSFAASKQTSSSFPAPSFPKYTKHVTITWWTWVADANTLIKAFEKQYPSITVLHPTIGAGTPEYNKLTTTLKAGTGAPDVVQIEYQYLPQFISTGGILDISKYDSYLRPFFLTWVWNQVDVGGKLYAVPEDIGPMGFMYRKEVLTKYHLAVPTTWAQFAVDAAAYHKAAPGQYFAYFPYNDGGWITAMLWQAGWRPFQGSGNNWKIDINTPVAQKVLNFWGGLIKNGAVAAVNDQTPQFQSELGKGLYAVEPEAAWGPTYSIEPYIKDKSQQWRVSDIPQWPGAKYDGNWGGSTSAVTVQSKNPDAAALFAAWINTSADGVKIGLEPTQDGGGGYFTASSHALQAPGFSVPDTFLGGQIPNPIFEKDAHWVNTNFQWSPWTSYVYNEMTVEMTKAASGKESFSQALENLQSDVVNFAKSEGYQVTT